jgi:hypothetical protein
MRLPGTDYSALRASPLRGRPSGVQGRSGAVFAASPRIARCAHDRRRWRADVQLAPRSSCRTADKRFNSGFKPLIHTSNTS